MTTSRSTSGSGPQKALLASSLLLGTSVGAPALFSLFQSGSSFFSSGYLAKFTVLMLLLGSGALIFLSARALLEGRAEGLLSNSAGTRLFQAALFALAVVSGLSAFKSFSLPATIFLSASVVCSAAAGLWWARKAPSSAASMPLPLSVSSLVLGLFLVPALLLVSGQVLSWLIGGSSSTVNALRLLMGGAQAAIFLKTQPYWLLGMGAAFTLTVLTMLVFVIRHFSYRKPFLLPYVGALKGFLISMGALATLVLFFLEWAIQRQAGSRYWTEKILSYLLYKMPPGVLWLTVGALVLGFTVLGWKSYKQISKGAK